MPLQHVKSAADRLKSKIDVINDCVAEMKKQESGAVTLANIDKRLRNLENAVLGLMGHEGLAKKG